MPRRTHRKSRLGCAECKKRHVKCDETHPICANCRSAAFSCSFSEDHGRSVLGDTPPQRQVNVSSSPGGSLQSEIFNRPDLGEVATNHGAHDVADVNMVHMELFHHFFRETYKTIIPGPLADDYCRSVTSCAIVHSYLMYATFSVSSFHLSTLRPNQKAHYRWLAIAFQARALKDINTVIAGVNADNCLAVLLFSQHIGLHSFIDVFSNTSPTRSFSTFLDEFLQSIRLIRGIYVVMMPWYSTLLATDIGRILTDSQDRHETRESGIETLSLRKNIEGATITQEDRATYLQSVDSLQRHFDANRSLSEEFRATPNTAFTWLITGGLPYLKLLDERRPEALVILAFYAVVLHHHRKSWVIGDAGRFLVGSIHEHLGRHWESWLEWPRREVFGS